MRWILKAKPENNDVRELSEALGVEELVATVLLQRDVRSFVEAKAYFRPQIEDLYDPFLMKDMELAVERILLAISRNENILVYGDYDVDGTTAVALLSSYLLEEYPNVATYIPDRYAEGYGISYKGIDFAWDNEFSLIIALDCGIKAIEKVAYAREKQIDFIICDHHRPGEHIPEAVAVLDPKREDCTYPYKELCGCGIGFKLIQAIQNTQGKDISGIYPYLDLVAVAIAADIVPITGENRILANFGLKVINNSPRPGIRAITEQLRKKTLTISDVVFVIAPRINAAGRMKHGTYAVNLLIEPSLEQAKIYAEEIEDFNKQRKGLDQQITDEALAQIDENKEQERYTSVVYKDSWHKGVIGIVASRLTETYYRPTLVFTKSGEKLAASARSVKGFDVYNALQKCSGSIEQFGGHKYAAGLTMEEGKYEEFKAKFEKVVSETIDPNLLTPEILIDTPISLKQITPKLYRILKQFAPFGPGNMNVVFMAENVRDVGFAKGVGEGQKHLKCSLTQNGSIPIGAIGFNLGHKLDLVKNKKPFSAVFSIEENEWNGSVSLQLRLRDIR